MSALYRMSSWEGGLHDWATGEAKVEDGAILLAEKLENPSEQLGG